MADEIIKELSEIEKAEVVIREHNEKRYAEYLQKLKNLDQEFGLELYVPQPVIRIRQKLQN